MQTRDTKKMGSQWTGVPIGSHDPMRLTMDGCPNWIKLIPHQSPQFSSINNWTITLCPHVAIIRTGLQHHLDKVRTRLQVWPHNTINKLCCCLENRQYWTWKEHGKSKAWLRTTLQEKATQKSWQTDWTHELALSPACPSQRCCQWTTAHVSCEECQIDSASQPPLATAQVPWWPASCHWPSNYQVTGVVWQPGELGSNVKLGQWGLTQHLRLPSTIRKYQQWARLISEVNDFRLCMLQDSTHKRSCIDKLAPPYVTQSLHPSAAIEENKLITGLSSDPIYWPWAKLSCPCNEAASLRSTRPPEHSPSTVSSKDLTRSGLSLIETLPTLLCERSMLIPRTVKTVSKGNAFRPSSANCHPSSFRRSSEHFLAESEVALKSSIGKSS